MDTPITKFLYLSDPMRSSSFAPEINTLATKVAAEAETDSIG